MRRRGEKPWVGEEHAKGYCMKLRLWERYLSKTVISSNILLLDEITGAESNFMRRGSKVFDCCNLMLDEITGAERSRKDCPVQQEPEIARVVFANGPTLLQGESHIVLHIDGKIILLFGGR
jgi:hypothetical protein